ncbi:trichohyalin-like [Xyrauchen texanus]|uniref:trichohyalin-like n=1 Tax=Xyrauchen texanus TaxID=154827 RepID=UPI00224239C8|nr:trichohyalin-like [Xyrauchen texanus]
MAKWKVQRSLSPLENIDDQGWDSDLDCRSFRHTLRSLSPLALSDLDFWDSRSLLKAQTSAWSCLGLSGSSFQPKISSSQCVQKHRDFLGMSKWSSASRLAPEGAPRSHTSTEELGLRAALEESTTRRAELVQKLCEAKVHLDSQTDLRKSRENQLQQSQSVSHIMELKQKQLSEAVSALEQDKEAAELSRFEESRRHGELQDKILQLEMDILMMRSNLERRTSPASPNLKNPLSRTLPVTKDDSLRQGQKHAEEELKKLREALRDAEERADDLKYEKDDVLRQLHSSKEGQQEALNQAEVLTQRLSSSEQIQIELEDQVTESRSHLGQMELERDLLSTKMRRLEDSLDDLKAKLSAALMDKDHLIQEKVELHQRVQALELQLQREQKGKQGFNEQVYELHSELSQAKSQTNRQKMDTILLKEELLSIKELNEKLSSDLNKATERLQVTLNQLYELEAEKLIQTNQITALENERLQLIGEKEALRKVFDDGNQDENKELKVRCYQNRELQDSLEQENQNLQAKCEDLEKRVQVMEAENNNKEEELQRMGADFEQEKGQLMKVTAHWNERWLDVAMTLTSTQAELEKLKKQQQENDKVSLEEMDGELVQVKAELQRVWDMLKIRDTQLEEQQQELQSARSKASEKCNEVQRLEQILAEREQELKEKAQDLKNQEIQRETNKAVAQIQISSQEHELLGNKDLQAGEEVVTSDCSPQDIESLKAMLKESRRRAEQLEQERDYALQKLHHIRPPQQVKTGKVSPPPETTKQRPIGSALVDPNQQRRLITEQLKSLFKEREQHGDRSPVLPKRPGLFENEVPNAKSTMNQNAVESQGRKSQKLEQEQDLQQGAAKESLFQTIVSPGHEKRSERGEEKKQLNNLKTHTNVISHRRKQTLRARAQPSGEKTFTTCVPHLQNLLQERNQQGKSPPDSNDGTFHARQIEVCDSDEEDAEESRMLLE